MLAGNEGGEELGMKLKILIAEDNKSIMDFYRKELPDEQFEKRLVGDGEQAIAAYTEDRPDIMLLDFMMPVKNGYQVLKAVRERFKDQATTIVMATSVADKDEVIACLKLGIQGYIVKPFTGEELRGKLRQCHHPPRKNTADSAKKT